MDCFHQILSNWPALNIVKLVGGDDPQAAGQKEGGLGRGGKLVDWRGNGGWVGVAGGGGGW